MADTNGITPAEFGTAFKRFVDAMNAEAAKETSPLLERLRSHLGGDPGRIPIVTEDFDNYEHPNVQVALDKVLSSGGRSADLPGDGIGPCARVERRDRQNAEGDPPQHQARIWCARDFEANRLQHGGDHEDDHRKDGEPVEPGEDASKQRTRIRSRAGRGEKSRRDRRAEHQRPTDEDRKRQVIEELEQVERQRLHGGIRAYREFPSDQVGLGLTSKGARMPTYRDYFADIKKRITEATPDKVEDLIRTGDVQLGDVREKDEWNAGHIPGAVHVPKSYLEQWAEDRLPEKEKTTILYCAGGVRSAMAADILQKLGYRSVISMAGGFNRWKDSGKPWTTPASLTPSQAQRYSRHLLIPEVGEAGQQRLLNSKVLLIGAGGLGSPAAYYLASAGVGTLGIVDSDVVDLTNLQRQILHTTDRIGESKVSSAKRTLEALNPDVKIVGYEERLGAANIDRIIEGYDVVIDGADNFPTRYLLNDASVKHRIPVVHGSIFRFEGQVTVFRPFEGPCYRCLFPEPPPPELAPSCAEAGVLGVLPGVIGTIQATEAIKLLLGIGEPLVGRYLLYDALEGSFREVHLRRDPECPMCGKHPTITDYIDYEGFCASPAQWRAQHAPAKVSTPAD